MSNNKSKEINYLNLIKGDDSRSLSRERGDLKKATSKPNEKSYVSFNNNPYKQETRRAEERPNDQSRKDPLEQFRSRDKLPASNPNPFQTFAKAEPSVNIDSQLDYLDFKRVRESANISKQSPKIIPSQELKEIEKEVNFKNLIFSDSEDAVFKKDSSRPSYREQLLTRNPSKPAEPPRASVAAESFVRQPSVPRQSVREPPANLYPKRDTDSYKREAQNDPSHPLFNLDSRKTAQYSRGLSYAEANPQNNVDQSLKNSAAALDKHLQERQRYGKRSPSQSRVLDDFKRRCRIDFEKERQKIESKKQYMVSFLFLLVLVLLIAFAIFVFNLSKRKPFCNSRDRSNNLDSENCDPCPRFGVCQNGEFVECQELYKKRGADCLRQEEDRQLVNEMYDRMLDIAAYYKGENEEQGGSGRVQIEQLKQAMQAQYTSEDFDATFEAVKQRLRSNTEVNHFDEVYFETSFKKYTLKTCVVIFLRERRLLLVVISVLIVLTFLSVVRVERELNKRARAQKMYSFVRESLNSAANNLLFEADIKQLLGKKFELGRSDLEEIFPYVRAIANMKEEVDFLTRAINGVEATGWWIDLAY